LKRELVSPDFVPEQVQDEVAGVIRMLTKDDFVRAFLRWLQGCKKFVRIKGGSVDKVRKYIFS
jgi:hypothetical protein